MNEDTKFMSETTRFADQPSPNQDLLNSICNIIVTGAPTGGDIIKLYRAYRNQSPPPSVELLRMPDVIEPIILATFAPGHSVNQMNEKLWLIAHAAFWNKSSDSADDVLSGRTLITDLSHLLEKTNSMIQLNAHFPSVLNFIQEPICASILLIWLKSKFYNDDFYEWTSLTMSIPCAFHILDEITVLHPAHRHRVFDIWISMFEREFEFKDMDSRIAPQVIIQYREKFIDHYVTLFLNHFEKPVLSYLASKSDTIDPSLMIHFLNKTVPHLEMPLNNYLYSLMLKMLQYAPGQIINASPPVQRLLAVGNHMDLDEETAQLHQKIELQSGSV